MVHDIFAAIALAMVLEGILPFLKPGSARSAYEALSRSSDTTLRRLGLLCMVVGACLLAFIRA